MCHAVRAPPCSSPHLLGDGDQAPSGLVTNITALIHYVWLM